MSTVPSENTTLLGRAVHLADGSYEWFGALIVAGLVPETTLRRALWVEGALARLTNRRATLEDVLRVRGHHVVRRIHEWAWIRTKEGVES